jgi:hypothetical protein
VEEVQEAVVDSLKSRSQFVYFVTQQVGFRPSEFVAQFGKAAQSDAAFVLSLRRKAQQPLKDWYGAVTFFEKDDFGSWQSDLSGRKNLAKLRNPSRDGIE